MPQQQQPNMQNQQMQMPQPPNVVTTKDHLYLKDMMSWNLCAMKKAYFFSQNCQDQDVKAALDRTYQMHERHYQLLLMHCENPNQPQQPGVQS